MTAGQHTVVVRFDGSAPSRARAARATSRWCELLDAEPEAQAGAAIDSILREDGGVPAGAMLESRLGDDRPAELILEVARADVPVTVIPPGATEQSAAP
jgi:hypothetical protein